MGNFSKEWTQKAGIPMHTIDRLEKWSKSFWLLIGFVLILGLGLLDFLTGYEFSFSLFYLLPIFLVVWFAGRTFGIVASTLSALVWFLADYLSGNQYSNPIIYFWNTAIRFGFFLIITLLLVALKKALQRERELSRTDRLTGATSVDFFYELFQAEIFRFQRYRHPLTLAYVDLDNFKAVNDRFGHSVGDQVLRTVVDSARKELRKTDIVARLGGDEFAFLFPETDQLTAQALIPRIQQGLIEEMKNSNWPVTFSIGVITFITAPGTVNELIKMADDLMYTVKARGKNAVSYLLYKS
jgi:diguanylate cyclase (GGDEF)-like protein